MTPKSTVAILSLALVTLVVAGCGGGSDDPFALPGGGGAAAPTGPAYDPSAATATISGSILFDGEAPTMAPIQMSADPKCMNEGALQQSVVVTDDGKLENVLDFIRSGHDESLAYPAPSTPVVLDQNGCRYSPHVFTLMTGQPLTFLNSDMTLHNVHAFPMVNMQVNIGQAVQGMENTESFAIAEGPFAIRCDVHRWMNAYTAVFDHPFHTTSGETGDYGINVPPGTYEVVAWHETYGEQVQQVTVVAGETSTLDYTYTPE
jgi:plastocyanin